MRPLAVRKSWTRPSNHFSPPTLRSMWEWRTRHWKSRTSHNRIPSSLIRSQHNVDSPYANSLKFLVTHIYLLPRRETHYETTEAILWNLLRSPELTEGHLCRTSCLNWTKSTNPLYLLTFSTHSARHSVLPSLSVRCYRGSFERQIVSVSGTRNSTREQRKAPAMRN